MGTQKSMAEDQEHLRLLSVFHYVVAGLSALFACFPIFHLIFGVVMIFGAGHGKNDPFPPALFGWLFVILAGTFMVFGWTLALCMLFAGRFLSQRRNRTFCLVVAGISCMFFPFGTVLGVFTLIVLMRPSVQDLFEGRVPGEPPPMPAGGAG